MTVRTTELLATRLGRWWGRRSGKQKVTILLAAAAVIVVLGMVSNGTRPFVPSVGVPPRTVAPAAGNYAAEYGGSPTVYAEIAATSDCDVLQAMFDTAGDNNDAAEPGTAEHRWTTGYMLAADARMQAVGCY